MNLLGLEYPARPAVARATRPLGRPRHRTHSAPKRGAQEDDLDSATPRESGMSSQVAKRPRVDAPESGVSPEAASSAAGSSAGAELERTEAPLWSLSCAARCSRLPRVSWRRAARAVGARWRHQVDDGGGSQVRAHEPLARSPSAP
eukprot:3131876-Prymnesium_polylepis.2